jgi:hypothetical protein
LNQFQHLDGFAPCGSIGYATTQPWCSASVFIRVLAEKSSVSCVQPCNITNSGNGGPV